MSNLQERVGAGYSVSHLSGVSGHFHGNSWLQYADDWPHVHWYRAGYANRNIYPAILEQVTLRHFPSPNIIDRDKSMSGFINVLPAKITVVLHLKLGL